MSVAPDPLARVLAELQSDPALAAGLGHALARLAESGGPRELVVFMLHDAAGRDELWRLLGALEWWNHCQQPRAEPVH